MSDELELRMDDLAALEADYEKLAHKHANTLATMRHCGFCVEVRVVLENTLEVTTPEDDKK